MKDQTTLIIEHLQNNPRIDPITALKKYGIFRLSARIFDAKEKGFNIKTIPVTHKGKRFATYELIK